MRKEDYLKKYFGYTEFRNGQEEIVSSLLLGKDVCAIMPTGAGKSLCYQLPALMFEGITIVISPLISLMKDQVESLNQMGINAAFINSVLNPYERRRVLAEAYRGRVKILYAAPERLLTEEFINFSLNVNISMIAVDEAHCVSQWGQDFRPSYLKIEEFVKKLPKRPVVGAFTATATEAVKKDIIKYLGLISPFVKVTGFDRKNLYFGVAEPKDKLSALLEFLKTRKDLCGIIYCTTRKTVDALCLKLNENGFPAVKYHAGMSDEARKESQEAFIYDKVKITVATNAFGMGIDKSNVSYVVHYNMPKDMESYYQEAGRAGRDGEKAECVVFYDRSDVAMNYFLINCEKEYQEGISFIEKEMLRQKEEKRLRDMQSYCHFEGCKRYYILKYFGENPPKYCGNCSYCRKKFKNKDITIDAQKIVSCVWRCERSGNNYTKYALSEILKGEKNFLIESTGADKLKTYGIMKNDTKDEILSQTEYLLAEGFLEEKEGKVFICEKSKEVVFDKVSINMPLTETEKIKDKSYEEKGLSADEVLLKELKEKRKEISLREHIPGYIIFTDASLKEMSIKKPVFSYEFMEIQGVGRRKLEKYGREFLDVIRQYRGFIQKESAEKSVKERVSLLDKLEREKKSASNKVWTYEEEEQLKDEFLNRKTFDEMARIHKRSKGAIILRLKKLGFMEE